jgi:hypothetical protein
MLQVEGDTQMRYIFLLLLLVSCGKQGVKERSTPPLPSLDAVRELYSDQMLAVQDSNGYVDTGKCDSVLHTALLGAGGVAIKDINSARNKDGQWFRRPLNYPECLANGQSKSTFSRDMLLGLMWYWYSIGEWKNAEEFYQYTSTRAFKFGDADGSLEGNSRVIMTPDLLSLLAELIFKMGGPNHVLSRTLGTRQAPEVLGFEAHLQILSILMWGRLTGYYTTHEIVAIRAHIARKPENALFQYAGSNYDEAERLLLIHHPADRLPSTEDFCNPLRYETELNPPCPEQVREHAPVHFMLISKWLSERK